jgi:hypothetical protein
VAGDKVFNSALVGWQSELAKQIVHGVQLGLHGELLGVAID